MDLFEREQSIYENAFLHTINVKSGAPLNFDIFETLTKEYGKLLKHVRRVTRISDKNTVDLFARNVDLTDKIHHDPLTGIFNRRYLEEALKKNIKELSRSGSLLSVLMIDIDFFKNYNDTYGHNEGDICLIAVAETILKCAERDEDFVARFGGEEFVVVLPHTDEAGARFTADKVLEKMAEKHIPHGNSGVADYVTVSIGVTTIKVKHTHNGLDYIKYADEALYKSKRNGRNKYTFTQFEEVSDEN